MKAFGVLLCVLTICVGGVLGVLSFQTVGAPAVNAVSNIVPEGIQIQYEDNYMYNSDRPGRKGRVEANDYFYQPVDALGNPSGLPRLVLPEYSYANAGVGALIGTYADIYIQLPSNMTFQRFSRDIRDGTGSNLIPANTQPIHLKYYNPAALKTSATSGTVTPRDLVKLPAGKSYTTAINIKNEKGCALYYSDTGWYETDGTPKTEWSDGAGGTTSTPPATLRDNTLWQIRTTEQSTVQQPIFDGEGNLVTDSNGNPTYTTEIISTGTMMDVEKNDILSYSGSGANFAFSDTDKNAKMRVTFGKFNGPNIYTFYVGVNGLATQHFSNGDEFNGFAFEIVAGYERPIIKGNIDDQDSNNVTYSSKNKTPIGASVEIVLTHLNESNIVFNPAFVSMTNNAVVNTARPVVGTVHSNGYSLLDFFNYEFLEDFSGVKLTFKNEPDIKIKDATYVFKFYFSYTLDTISSDGGTIKYNENLSSTLSGNTIECTIGFTTPDGGWTFDYWYLVYTLAIVGLLCGGVVLINKMIFVSQVRGYDKQKKAQDLADQTRRQNIEKMRQMGDGNTNG